MSSLHQLDSSADTSSEYVFGTGIGLVHGIPQCMMTAASRIAPGQVCPREAMLLAHLR